MGFVCLSLCHHAVLQLSLQILRAGLVQVRVEVKVHGGLGEVRCRGEASRFKAIFHGVVHIHGEGQTVLAAQPGSVHAELILPMKIERIEG